MIRRPLYAAAAALMGLLFSLVLYEPLRGLLPEVDLWWMMPAFSYHVEGRTGWELWTFLLGPAPSYFAFPSHKLMLGFLHALDLPLGAWSGVSAGIHAANALLLGWLCRMMGLSRRASWLAGITFLSLFIHFHAIVWLPGTQHVPTIFTILGTLLLFLTTERRILEGRPSRAAYGATLLFVAAASIQNAAILVALLMLTHILAHPSRSPQERFDKYVRWSPAFLLATLYPVVSHSISYVKPLVSVIGDVQAAPWLKITVLLSLITLLLAAGGALLRALARRPSAEPLARAGLWAGVGAVALILALRDSRQVFLPYNVLSPFVTALFSFLDPFGTLLRIDSSMSYHYVPANMTPVTLFVGALVLGLFAAAILRHKRRFLLFGVWYAVILLYLLLHRHVASNMPLTEAARYYMYITPVLCAVFCPVALFLYLRFARWMGWRGWVREAALLLLFSCFWTSNLLAIRLELLRGRVAATYYILGDVRAVEAIREDLLRLRGSEGSSEVGVLVEGVVPMAYHRKWDWPVQVERMQYRLFRRLAEEAWRGKARVRGIWIEGEEPGPPPPPPGAATRVYRIEDGRVRGPDGPLEGFVASFEAGARALREGRHAEAGGHLEAAARARPFLLNYILTPKGRLSDLPWIIEGADLEDWLNTLGSRGRRWSIAPKVKWEGVQRAIRSDLDDYRTCLLYLAYIRWKEGRNEESLFWLSRTRFLEKDVDRLAGLLRADPLLTSDPSAAPFLAGLKGGLGRRDSLPWRKNDYAFGRWLVRVLAGRDILSRWDRQFPEPP